MQSWCPLPRTYEGRPRRGRAAYTAVYGARLSSVPSGDRSANPASVPGRSGLQRAHISVSSARKRSGAEMLATPSGVSAAASSAFSCRCAIPGYQTSRSNYTGGQSRETGPLVDYLAAWKLLLSVSPWVLHTVERLQNPDGFSSASIQRGESHFGGPRAGSGNGTRSRVLS